MYFLKVIHYVLINEKLDKSTKQKKRKLKCKKHFISKPNNNYRKSQSSFFLKNHFKL